MAIAVIVFSFPEPDDNKKWAEFIEQTKQFFTDIPDVKVHAAINESAREILTILEPEE